MATSYEDIISSFNLGKTDAALGTTLVPNLTDYGADGSGNAYITYTFFQNGTEVGDSYYLDGGDEETHFESTYNQDLENVTFGILNDGSYWSTSFNNIIKVNFIKPENLSDPNHQDDIGIITFGQLTSSHPQFSNPAASALTAAYDEPTNGTLADEVYGDVWFNMDHEGAANGLAPNDNIWTDFGDIEKGTAAYKVIYEEIAHAMGIDFLNIASVVGAEEATEKYSITSYIPHGHVAGADLLPDVDTDSSSVILWGEDNDGDGNQDVLHAYGLQLYDIAALQALYGAQTTARTNDDTYKLGQGFGRDGNGDFNVDANDKGSAFIYTIWDGAGNDTIDASDFDTFGAKINLNAGAFSSIGTDGKGGAVYDKVAGLDGENVAIAYNTDIENAIGTKNNDTLIGNNLDNVLTGGQGDDDLQGGSGNDTYIYNLSDGKDIVMDTAGVDDVLRFGAGIAVTNLNFTVIGNDLKIALSGASNSEILIKNYTGGGLVENILFEDELFLDPAAGAYNIINGSNALHDNITGTSGKDIINGFVGNDILRGEDGDDILNGGDGNDRLYGGDGNDYLDSGLGTGQSFLHDGAGDDIVLGSNRNDIFFNSPGSDFIDGKGDTDSITADDLNASALSQGLIPVDHGINFDLAQGLILDDGFGFTGTIINVENITGSSFGDILTAFNPVHSGINGSLLDAKGGDDVLYGGIGKDNLRGGDGDDTINGGLGDDLIVGGRGDDVLLGGSGSDAYWYATGTGHDIITDIEGSNDVISYLGSDAAQINPILKYVANDLEITFGNAGDKITIINQNDGTGTSQIERISFQGGATRFLLAPNTIDGTANDEMLTGAAGNDTINGLDGNDILVGNAGDDILNGGAGDDTYTFNIGDGNNTINETDGFDTISLGSGLTLADLTFTQIGNDLDITIASGFLVTDFFSGDLTKVVEQILFDDSSTFDLTTLLVPPNTDPLANDDSATTDQDVAVIIDVLANDSDADTDTLTVGTVGLATNGTAVLNGDNTITYTPNAGYSGADSFTYSVDDGNGGTDTATVNVTVNAAITYNVINGTTANNTINGTSGNDEIHGMAGHDYLYGHGSDDILYGETGHDYLYGGDGNDTLYGGDVNGQDDNSNHLYGDGGNDTLYATSFGGERLYGGSGNDILHGNGGGYDRLYGDAGDDTLFADNGTNGEFQGGADIDTVVYNVNSAGFVLYRAQAGQLRLVDTNGTFGENIIIKDDVESLQFSDLILDLTSLTFTVGGAGWGISVPKYLGSGSDVYTAYPVASEIHGMAGHDTITGSQSSDTLFGENGHDYLYGGDGDDTLYAGDVNGQDDNSNHLYGDAGDDILYAASIGGDRLYGGSGNDILHGNGGGYDRLYGDAGDDTLYADDGTNGEFQGGADIDTVVYNVNSAGFVLYRAQVGQLRLVDTSGTYGENIIIYDDVENLQFSDLTLDLTSLTFTVGGAGWGTSVPKYLGSGNQTYTAYPVASEVHGGLGADTITGSQSDDTLFGDNGYDYLYGGDGNDALYAGDVNGQDDNSNHLYGDAGDDILYGGNGGIDNLYGGTGADTFVFKDGVAFSYADRINDFSTAEGDSMDVSDILTGYDPLTDLIADFVQITDNGTDSFLAVDADGGADNFVQIATLKNVLGLTDEAALVTSGNLIAA